MRAAVLYAPGDLRVVDAREPSPSVDEVLIRVKACAICGTDPKIIANGWQNQPPFGEFIPGHEYAGVIVDTGEGVEEFAVGDRVVVEPHKGCGRCVNCVRGSYTICLNYGRKEKGHRHYGFTANGGYAEYAVNHVNTVHKIPESIGFEEASLLTGAGTVLYAVERAGWISPAETVLVAGPGPIGLIAVQVARDLGAAKVILSGTRPARLQMGKDLGADEVINVMDADITAEAQRITGSVGVDLAMECSGNADSASQLVRLCRKGGRISVIGIYDRDVPMPLNDLVQKNIAVIGSRAEGMWNLRRAVDLMTRGLLQTKPLITHTFPLEEINEALRVYKERVGDAIKVVVKP